MTLERPSAVHPKSLHFSSWVAQQHWRGAAHLLNGAAPIVRQEARNVDACSGTLPVMAPDDTRHDMTSACLDTCHHGVRSRLTWPAPWPAKPSLLILLRPGDRPHSLG